MGNGVAARLEEMLYLMKFTVCNIPIYGKTPSPVFPSPQPVLNLDRPLSLSSQDIHINCILLHHFNSLKNVFKDSTCVYQECSSTIESLFPSHHRQWLRILLRCQDS